MLWAFLTVITVITRAIKAMGMMKQKRGNCKLLSAFGLFHKMLLDRFITYFCFIIKFLAFATQIMILSFMIDLLTVHMMDSEFLRWERNHKMEWGERLIMVCKMKKCRMYIISYIYSARDIRNQLKTYSVYETSDLKPNSPKYFYLLSF